MYFIVHAHAEFLAISESQMGPNHDLLQVAGYTRIGGQIEARLREQNGAGINTYDAAPHSSGLYAASAAVAIDDHLYPTDIIGWSMQSGVRRGHIWRKPPLPNGVLPNPWGGADVEPRGVNASGDIVGWASNQAGEHRATLWPAGGQPVDLGNFGGRQAEANAINNAGQIVGWAEELGGGHRAFLWTPNGTDGDPANQQMLNLGALKEPHSEAYDLNDNEEVVGGISGIAASPGFHWTRANGMTPILGLGANTVRALAINRNGLVVGTAATASGKQFAVRWLNGTLTDLNAMTPGASATLLLTRANCINGSGCIAGQALDVTTGDTRGFFLVPVDLGLDQPVPIRSQVERPLWAEITHILSRAVVYGGGGVGIGPNGELVPIPPHGPAAMAERFVSTSNDVMLLMCMLDAIGAMTDRSARASVQRAVLAEAAKIVSRLASGIPQRGPVNGKRNKETASA